MKTINKILILFALTGSLFMTACYGNYYVTSRPQEPYYIRPSAPYADAVWIDGEWVWNGRGYNYIGGHWVNPRSGRTWVRGNWESGPRGYVWRKGYWR
jgi:hypothetical protein